MTICLNDYSSRLGASSSRPDFAPNTELPRHRWYRFKEGFSAGLVRDFIGEYLPARKVRLFDPFLGSGTTAVEGARLGHLVDGVETNPFMAFMSTVKSADFSCVTNLEGSALQCLKAHERDARFALPQDTTLVEREGLEKWLLNSSVAKRFEELRTAIELVRPAIARDLLLLALVSSVELGANARKDGKCWRYKRRWREIGYDARDLDNAFAGQVLIYADDIASCPKLNGSVKVTQGDARELNTLNSLTADARYDGLLTSPPYLNSFDYTDIYRPELFLLNAARNAKELRQIRFSTLRSHVQVAWLPSAPLDVPLLQEKVSKVGEAGSWCTRIPAMINAYFVDLDRVVEQCARRLSPGAIAGFVVADSAYAGVVIPVDQILSEILERRGFTIKRISTLRQSLGNGHHQQRSMERLNEVLVVAEFKSRTLSRGR